MENSSSEERLLDVLRQTRATMDTLWRLHDAASLAMRQLEARVVALLCLAEPSSKTPQPSSLSDGPASPDLSSSSTPATGGSQTPPGTNRPTSRHVGHETRCGSSQP